MCLSASILTLDLFCLFPLISVWEILSSFFSQLCLGFSILLLLLLQGFLLFLVSLDDKSVTDLIGFCQNEYSDIEDRKWWCVHLKISVLSPSTFAIWLSKKDGFHHFTFIIAWLNYMKSMQVGLFFVVLLPDLHS